MKALLFVLAIAACADSATPPSSADDWRARVADDLAAMPAAQRTELAALEPSLTRAQFLRFTTKAIHDPRAASVFLDRLATRGESDEVRAALVDALPRTGGVYADAVLELLPAETSPLVRAAYVHTARRAPEAQALAIATRGLADADPQVVAEAIRATATLDKGAQLAPQLERSLGASSEEVRVEAIRALGILRVTTAADAIARARPASDEEQRAQQHALTRLGRTVSR